MASDQTSQNRISQEEISQTKARLGILIFGLLYLTFFYLFIEPTPSQVFWLVLGYAIFSAFWLVYISKDRSAPTWRRILGLLGDLGLTTYVLYILGETGSFFYPLYLRIIVAYGVRFGPRFLLASTVLGAFLFGNVLLFSPYWHENLIAGLGLWAGIIILPLLYLSLIRRVQKTNTQLQAALKEAEVAMRAKSAFLANMSHELRTPMHGVIGTAELMQTTPLNDTQKDYMTLIGTSAKSLLTIINDILDFSQLEAGKLKLHQDPLDIHRLIKEVMHIFKPQSKSKGLRLTWSIDEHLPAYLLGDEIRIRQVLFNLVGNAVKYTLKGSIHVQVRLIEVKEEVVFFTVEVQDTGIGIPKANLKDIFGEFERVDKHREHRFSGTGLGLPISQNLVKMMGGIIEAQSEVGIGSTFIAKFKLRVTMQKPSEVMLPSDSNLKTYPLQALVVEDNHVNQIITKAFLQKLGVSGEVAQNGFEAQSWYQKQPFDLILMDYQLPGMSGTDITRWIRDQEQNQVGKRIPIIALTANVSPQDKQACLEAGMDDYLTKPLTFEALQNVMANLEQAGRI